MRNLANVIDQMVAKIPEGNSSFILDLEKVKESASYSAPEIMDYRWRDAQAVMNIKFYGRIHNDLTKLEEGTWQMEVHKIWTDTK